MEYSWEEFSDGAALNTKNRIHVTINSRCKIFFKRHALAALGLPNGVALMYDRHQKVIGVKASPLNRKGCYPLWKKQERKSNGRMITAANFCRKYAIAPNETLAFPNAEVRDEILILDLNDVRSVAKM